MKIGGPKAVPHHSPVVPSTVVPDKRRFSGQQQDPKVTLPDDFKQGVAATVHVTVYEVIPPYKGVVHGRISTKDN